MKIIVCVKRVPDTATRLKIKEDGKTIDTSDIEYIVSPYDEYAVEHAVQIKEKKEGVEVVVVSMGPSESEKIMRSCLAMGADRGILLETDQSLMDPYITAKALVNIAEEEKPDIIFCGIKAADDDNAQVAAMIATLMDLPFIEGAITLELKDNAIQAKTEIEGGYQIIEAPFPCVLSINKGGVEPRICSLINIRKARKKELKKISPSLESFRFQVEKMQLPAERKGGKIVGEGPDAVPELFRLLREEAKVL